MRTEIPLLAHRIRFRGVEREVLTHRGASGHAFLAETGPQDWYLFADAGGFMHLAELAAVMAASRDRIAFYRHGPCRPRGMDTWEAMDLLFVPHTLQFPASGWKEVRQRLGRGLPVTRTAKVPPERDPTEYYRRYDEEDREVVDVRAHARTLVVSGSPRNFTDIADGFAAMAGAAGHDHAHFQDRLRLRGYPSRDWHQAPHPDLIYIPRTRWSDGEDAIRQETRWLLPGTEGHNPAHPERALSGLEAEGWQIVWREGAYAELIRAMR